MVKKMKPYIDISGRLIGMDYPVYVVAELSANHRQQFDEAAKLIEIAKEIGADAIKLQTYTPDTLTISSDKEYFYINDGTPWDGRTLYDLYQEAYMPWEWQPKLKKLADGLGISLFSTPYDKTAVDFLEEMEVPAYKVASFELVDIPLIEYIAKKGKPIIMSTGMAEPAEINEAVQSAHNAGNTQIALLKCTSAYPASPEEMNLRAIPYLAEAFSMPIGLSDHTLGMAVPVSAVTLGACIIEKHLTLSRDIPGPDSVFSSEPQEFKAMVTAIRTAEKALGDERYEIGKQETKSHVFRRSLFVIKDVKTNEAFTEENVRSIRPGYGMHPRYLKDVLGRRAALDIERGTPLAWELIA